MTSWRSEKRQRTKLVALRLTPDEHQRISRAAAQIGMSLGGFIRAAAINSLTDIEGLD